MLGGFHIFISRIAGYSDLGGLHAPVLGGLRIFINSIAGYGDLGGLHDPVLGNFTFL